uniref:IQ domain-containing protein N n=1 Tax=Molossus molossus TaxID=27622 RepID=A0A7J8I819_MOLMO|nr:IQ motif containing N [Molossus molossus]
MQQATQLQLSPNGQSSYQSQPSPNLQDKVGTLCSQPPCEPPASRETLPQQLDKDKKVLKRIPRLRAVVESQAFKNVLVDEMDMMLSRAATLIQANWRGYRLRQKLISQMSAAKAIQEAWRRFNNKRLLRSGKAVEKKLNVDERDIPYHPPQQVRFQYSEEGKSLPASPVMVSKETQFPSADSLASCAHQLALLRPLGIPQPSMQAPCATGGSSVTFLPHQTVPIRLPCPVSLDAKYHPCLLTRTIRSNSCVHLEGNMIKTTQVTVRANKAGASGPPPSGKYAQALYGSLKTQTQAHVEAEGRKAPPQTGQASVITKTLLQPCLVPTITMTKTPPQRYPAAVVTKTPLQSCLASMMNKTQPQPCPPPTVIMAKTPPQMDQAAPVAKTPFQSCLAAILNKIPTQPCPVPTIMLMKTPPQSCLTAPMTKTPAQMQPTASMTNTAPHTQPAAMTSMIKPPTQTCPVPAMAKTPPQTCPVPAMAKTPPQTCPVPAMAKTPPQTCPVPAMAKTPPQTCPVPAMAKTPLQMHPVATMAKTPLQTCPVATMAKTPSQMIPGASVTKTPPQTRLVAMITKTPAQLRSMAATIRTLCLPPTAAGNLKASPPTVLAAGTPNTSSHTYLNRPKAKAVVTTRQMAGTAKVSSHSHLTEGKMKYCPPHLGAGAPKAPARPFLEAEKIKTFSQKQIKTATMSNTSVAKDRTKVLSQAHLKTDVMKVQSQVYVPVEMSGVQSQAQQGTYPTKTLPQAQMATFSTTASPQGHLLRLQTTALPQANLGTCLSKPPPQAHPPAKLTKAPSLAHLGTCLTKTQSQAHLTTGVIKVKSQAHLPTGLTKAQSQAQLVTETAKCLYAAHQAAELNGKTQSQPLLAGFKASTQPCQHVGSLGTLSRAKPEDRLTQLPAHSYAQGKATQGPCQGAPETPSKLVPLLASAGHPTCNIESWGDSGATRAQPSTASPAVPCEEELGASQLASLCAELAAGPVDAGVAGGQAWNTAIPSVAIGLMNSTKAPCGSWEPARCPMQWDAEGSEAALDSRRFGELVASVQTVEKIIVQAAVTIQACARGYLVRRTIKVWHQWAIIIQAAWRGYCVRRNLAQLCRAATIIQATWRGYFIRRSQTQQMLLPGTWIEVGGRARCTSDHRCFQSCQPHVCTLCQSLSPQLGSPPSAVMLVGSSPRTCHMCGQTLPTRVVQGMGQGTTGQRGMLWDNDTQPTPQGPQQPHSQSKAATIIQSTWRGFVARRQLRQQQVAAKMLQATWRGHYTRASLTTDALLGTAAWDNPQNMQWPGV